MIIDQRIRKALINLLIFIFVLLTLAYIFKLLDIKVISTYLQTKNIVYAYVMADEPYPPPTTPTSTQDNSEENLPYPPPDNGYTNTSPVATLPPIPTDRIVAVYSNGEFTDLNTDISTYSDIVQVNGELMYVPPTYPENPENAGTLRIIGGDDRFQILDTKVFPWTTVVKIEGQYNSYTYFVCTGWMLGQSTVVTAGHCVYNYGQTNRFAYNVTITPALNTDDTDPTPFGSCDTLDELVLNQWFLYGDPGYDYGVYRLGCKVGQQTGNFGFKDNSWRWCGSSGGAHRLSIG